MKRMLLGLAAGLLFVSCGPTTYGQVVQQQKRAQLQGPEDQAQRAPPAAEEGQGADPTCPTLAREGSIDFARCEAIMQQESGTGGSGSPVVDIPPEAAPDVRYWRDSDERP